MWCCVQHGSAADAASAAAAPQWMMPTPQFAATFNDYHSLLASLRLERESMGIQSQSSSQARQVDGRGHSNDNPQQQHEVDVPSAHRIALNGLQNADAAPADAFDAVDMAARANVTIPAGVDIRTATAHLTRTLDQVIPAPMRSAPASSSSSSSSHASSSSSSARQQTAALDSARRVNFALQTNAALVGGLVHSMGARAAPPPLLPLDDDHHSEAGVVADSGAGGAGGEGAQARLATSSARDRDSLSARSKQKMKLGMLECELLLISIAFRNI